MKDTFFINEAFDTGIKSFLECENKKDSLLYNSFLVVVIRVLAFIYGKLDIVNPYYLKNNVALINNLSKYGVNKSDILNMFEELLLYYKIESEDYNKKFKRKNPHFTKVQEYLVDMFIMKKRNSQVSYQEEEEFLELIYTTHTKNAYQISYNYLVSNDPGFIEKYYYSKLNNQDVTRVDLDKTISKNINLEALNFMGINLSNIHNLSESEIMDAQDGAYRYFDIDVDSTNRDEELKKAMNYYKTYGRKVTTGNGYVDILLLMSVIATSISIIVIILLHI